MDPITGEYLGMQQPNKRSHGLGKNLRSPSRLVLIALNLLVYILLIRWVHENIQLERLAEYFGQLSILAILGSLCINLISLALYGVRMALLLGKGFYTAFSIVNIGYALNTLLPLRLGEAMKIYLGNSLFGVPLTGLFAASIAEKLIDLGKVLFLAGIVMLVTTGEYVQASTLRAVSILVAVSAATIALFHLYIVRIVKLLPKRSRLRRISIELHKHARNYPIALILTVTAAIWTFNIGLVLYSFNTYLPGVHVNILDAIALLLILALAIAIPSAPAGLGLFEAGIVTYLTQKNGVHNEAALAAAFAFHLVITIPQLVMTGWLLWSRPNISGEVKMDN